MIDDAKKKLAKNTIYLYALTFSSQLISLLTIPYQTRVLSPDIYGIVSLFIGVMVVVSLVINFGFLYSATEDVALSAADRGALCSIYSAVFCAKGLLALLLAVPIFAAAAFVDVIRSNASLFFLYYLSYVFGALLPDYLYRGLELMKAITIRTVAIRLFSAVLIFVFLKSPQDVLILPMSLLLGNSGALVACFQYDRKILDIKFCRISAQDIFKTLKRGLPFFVSRIASTVYQTGNVIVVGLLYPGQSQVGWYSASDKVLTVVKQVSAPVADSIYPYMIKKRDYRLSIKVMLAAVPLILLGCGLLFLYAEPVCAFAFGEDYAASGNVLRCLLPAMAVIFPTYIICFPVLVPMGLSKQANTSNVVGMVSQILLLVVLFIAGHLNVYTVCLSASASEVLVFLYRLGTMIRYRDRMKAASGVTSGKP